MKRILFALTALLLASVAQAQQVRVKGYGEPDVDQLLRAALANSPIMITRDTIVRDTIRSNVVVVKARFILEGVVQGDLTGIGANVYLRPPARVTGQVLNVGGGYYPSELAKVGTVEDHPLAPYRISTDGSDYLVEGMVKRPAMRWLGAFQLPEYNRVDGLRLEAGPTILLPPLAGVEPAVSASIGYATERKDALGRVRLDLRRGLSTLSAGWEDDVTLTNERWIRSPLKNSMSFIWNGKDYRNYYKADRTFIEFRRTIEEGIRTTQYFVRGQNEIADPLPAGDPWILFDPDSIRSNWLVPHSRIASLIVGTSSIFTGATSAFQLNGTLEFAGNRGTGTKTNFNAYTAHALYAARALADHTLEIEGEFRGPLPGTDDLPLQRWTIAGGSGTLYTYDVGTFQGDRLAFVKTEYRVPFAARLTMPFLGRPQLRMMHHMGMVWSRTSSSRFEQEVGARVQFAIGSVRYLVNPRTHDSNFDIGFSFPSKPYPWEKSSKQ